MEIITAFLYGVIAGLLVAVPLEGAVRMAARFLSH